MKESKDISISLESLCLLASFTVRETLTTLQDKGLISNQERDVILGRAVNGLSMSTIGLTKADTDNLLSVLLGTPFNAPKRNLN